MILLDEKNEVITLNGRNCVSHDPKGEVSRDLSRMLFKGAVSGVDLGFGRGGSGGLLIPISSKLCEVGQSLHQNFAV